MEVEKLETGSEDHRATSPPRSARTHASRKASGSTPSTVAWFHAIGGISGDMALGALVDAGADLDEVRSLLSRLPVAGWQIETRTVVRSSLTCTQLVVTVEHDPTARTCGDILALVDAAGYPPRLTRRVHSVFTALSRVEGRIHGVPPEEVHFHEVGSVDAIVDVVGTCAALEVLAVDEVQAGPVAVGIGAIEIAHGRFPNPAPAVVRLLEGAPIYGVDIDAELTTPTGAALLAALVARWGAPPAMVPRASGFGAGAQDLPGMLNATEVVLGTLWTRSPGASC